MKRIITQVTGVCALTLLPFLFWGLVAAIETTSGSSASAVAAAGKRGDSTQASQNPSTEKREEPGRQLIVVSAGDSIAFGVGDSEGLGIGKRLAKRIEESFSLSVKTVNIAAPGATSADFLRLLESGESDPVLSDSDIILISIGGNDLHKLMREGGEAGSAPLQDFQRNRLEEFQNNLKKSISLIRQANKETIIVIYGIYNPYRTIDDTEFIQDLLRWNLAILDRTVYDDLTIPVPLFDLFQGNADLLLNFDGIHPNITGYDMIAERTLVNLQGTLQKNYDSLRSNDKEK